MTIPSYFFFLSSLGLMGQEMKVGAHFDRCVAIRGSKSSTVVMTTESRTDLLVDMMIIGTNTALNLESLTKFVTNLFDLPPCSVESIPNIGVTSGDSIAVIMLQNSLLESVLVPFQIGTKGNLWLRSLGASLGWQSSSLGTTLRVEK